MEFVDLGAHCAVGSCRQQDFLPFECDACHQRYCLSHRSYTGHNCPQAAAKDYRVFVCPLCQRSIDVVPTEDANLTWQRHSTSGSCQPKPSSKAHKCAASRCKTLLTPINSITCPTCGSRVCLTHRYTDQHSCRPQQKTSGFLSWFSSQPSVACPRCKKTYPGNEELQLHLRFEH
jgi:uncharacterized protein YbaR (Trm112 family)